MKTIKRKITSYIVSALLLSSITTTAMADLAAGKADYILKKYAEALRELKPLADSGDPEAQTMLGTLYANGWGAEKNSTEAFSWYSKAAAQGNTEAQIALSDMYKDGVGTSRDTVKSDYWQWKAASAFELNARQSLAEDAQKSSDLQQIVVTQIDPATVPAETRNRPQNEEKDGLCHFEYPALALKKGLQGMAILVLTISPDGKVEEANTVRSSGAEILDESAVSSIKQCKFTPEMQGNTPVRGVTFVAFRWEALSK